MHHQMTVHSPTDFEYTTITILTKKTPKIACTYIPTDNIFIFIRQMTANRKKERIIKQEMSHADSYQHTIYNIF